MLPSRPGYNSTTITVQPRLWISSPWAVLDQVPGVDGYACTDYVLSTDHGTG